MIFFLCIYVSVLTVFFFSLVILAFVVSSCLLFYMWFFFASSSSSKLSSLSLFTEYYIWLRGFNSIRTIVVVVAAVLFFYFVGHKFWNRKQQTKIKKQTHTHTQIITNNKIKDASWATLVAWIIPTLSLCEWEFTFMYIFSRMCLYCVSFISDLWRKASLSQKYFINLRRERVIYKRNDDKDEKGDGGDDNNKQKSSKAEWIHKTTRSIPPLMLAHFLTHYLAFV